MLPAGPCVGLVGNDVAFAVVEPDQVRDLTAALVPDFLESWRHTLPSQPANRTVAASEIALLTPVSIFNTEPNEVAVPPTVTSPAGTTGTSCGATCPVWAGPATRRWPS